MKVGQLFSMIEFDGLPEEQRTELESRLATLRDDVPPVPFVTAREADARGARRPARSASSRSFDERAFAAASIGQVHRATTLDGDEVVVKVQYPGVAEAVDSDLRSATLLLPLHQAARARPRRQGRCSPSCASGSARSSTTSSRRSTSGASSACSAATRSSPCRGCGPTSRTRRVLVSEFVEGERFEAVRALDQAQRDRYGEIVFRFFFGLLYRHRIALGDPHPGNYLLRPDGRVAFLDYGLVRELGAARIDAERAIALAVRSSGPRRARGGARGRRLRPERPCRRASTPSWRCG